MALVQFCEEPMPNSQYYEQGQRDAETGQLNQLLYHTYLDYKRGYDERLYGPPRRRRWTWLWVGLIVAAAFGGGWVLRDRGILVGTPTPVVQVVTPTNVIPTPTFPFVIATAAPATPTAVVVSGIGIGASVQVSTDGGNLRVRPEPSLNGEPVASLSNGSIVQIIAGPTEGDGYTWWQIDTGSVQGWVAADFLEPQP